MNLTKIAACLTLVLVSPAVTYCQTDTKIGEISRSNQEEYHSVRPVTVKVKIIAINDFHGQLESPGSFRSVSDDSLPRLQVGGVDWLAGYIADLKDKNQNTTVVSAGDLIGASPLISALFHDEGTVETMNRAGLEINAVGNHEFDEGKDELMRMQFGGCHPVDENSCRGYDVGTPVPFEGAWFDFLAANVSDGEKNLFPAYKIKEYDGVKVAYIGLTLKETPTIVAPSGVQGLIFSDEADTVNRLVPELHEEGVKAIVVLIHQGGTTPIIQAESTINDCAGDLEGSPIKAIVSRLSNAVDLVISGHTHQAYNCLLPTKSKNHLIPVTSANSQGRVITDIDLYVDQRSGQVKNVKSVNLVIDRANTEITPDRDIKQIVDKYRDISQPIANRVIGSITATLSRTPSASGESQLGDIIADAQLSATNQPGFGDAAIAFMNPGGIRADLIHPGSGAGEGDGNVTFGEAFTVQPFGNSLVTMTLTGAQIEALLEQQFPGCPNEQPFNRVLQVSEGFSYQWNPAGPPCDKVDPDAIQLNGTAIDPAARYRITVNSFLADGGDKFEVLTAGTDRLGGAQDLDALEAFFKEHSPVSPDSMERIRTNP